MKHNDRLQRVQVGREEDTKQAIDEWFLVIYKNGDWDSDNRLGNFLEDIKLNKVQQVFCVWHGTYRTNLFLMDLNYIINLFKDSNAKK